MQSGAITKYVAKQTGFYPDDDWKVALSDEVLWLTEDVTSTLRPALTVQVRTRRGSLPLCQNPCLAVTCLL